MPKRGDINNEGLVYFYTTSGVDRWYPRDEFDRKVKRQNFTSNLRREKRLSEFEKLERTLKRGAVRLDGKIFWGYDKGFKDFEYWVSPEHFKKLMARRKTPKSRKQINETRRERYKNDPAYKATNNCRARIKSRVRMFIKSNGIKRNRRPKYDCGCSKQELVRHLESQFKEGMSWKNYGQWHIDHIKPLCSFDMSNDDDVKTAMHFTNLQPLWAEENFSKSGKY